MAQQQGEVANVDRQAVRVATALTELQRAVADNAKHATADLAAIRARLAA